ncbi:DUF6710 family protein [Staphylococcus aureus]|uniref:DUF6710 family protein n=2 Tax=Staphylococcus aureus TaxID=1280 RepID=UPI000DE4FD05|nr:DUF6710 family protein [Staphylococcus aureus]HDE3760592.1 hypothetical protein [Staphylococcus aureus]HDE6087103.1 hypothetical protein [Staphylococcus aureus]HDE6300832.1 hypothetical protein [Staphylococcus aureus]HDE7633328.1 hypothetical protein [Staphylococcus aureus]HDE8127323.1 hypothetical protein [Staphylococcus aureus]
MKHTSDYRARYALMNEKGLYYDKDGFFHEKDVFSDHIVIFPHIPESPRKRKKFEKFYGGTFVDINSLRASTDEKSKKRMEYILDGVRSALGENVKLSKYLNYTNDGQYIDTDRSSVFSIIKMLTDSYHYRTGVNLLFYRNDTERFDIDKFVDLVNPHRDAIDIYTKQACSYEKNLDKALHYYNKDYPIISMIWNPDRVLRNIMQIGGNVWDNKHNKYNDFEVDDNHDVVYVYPMGVVLTQSGNHSVNAGKVKGEGSIKVDKVWDISPLYEEYYFDGRYLLDNDGDKYEIPFELGIVFEIGRILKEYESVFDDNIISKVKGGIVDE